ncbi:MAG: hypothetical protein V4760_12775, partial [Bdellovibrionota bacterium]
MANNWWDGRNDRDDQYPRRNEDRSRDFGRGSDGGNDSGNYPEPYRAGDQDAHRNDREMAFGNFN